MQTSTREEAIAMSVSGEQRPATARRFPSPLEVVIPGDSAGWEEMYAYQASFRRDRSQFEEGRFWFQEALHAPEPLHPFDAVTFDCAAAAFSHAASRLFVLPDSLGVEYRILNGYVYVSANSVTDPLMVERRAELYSRRSAHYYEHWDEIYETWLENVETATQELRRLEVPALGEFEPESVVRDGGGLGAAHLLLAAWDRLMEGLDRIFHFHFELLHLGYGAYLIFYELCRDAFPDVDDQIFARMFGAIDVLVLRPDEELRRLARRAVELDVAADIKEAHDEESLVATLSGSETGRAWLTDYEETKDPWFYFSCGTGAFYHHHRSWIDDPALPISTIGSYIERLEAGAEISRPAEAIHAERERTTQELRGLLPEGSRAAFDERLALARKVFPYVENHNFYIDHRYMTIFWNKVRDFGALLTQKGVLVDGEDIFYLRHDEIRSALEDVRLWWSSGADVAPRGREHWPPIVERRKLIYGAMRRWSPPNALGRVPDRITEPMTVMLWGVTEERIEAWLSPGEGTERISGIPGSPGVIEGRARVVVGIDELNQIEDGDVLVAPTTSTSWTPVFGRIAGAVLDIGGVMSHAAIVAREYGLPAVIGTGTATKRIRSGDLVRVDADAGIVTILERARAG
jgi:pyruvate,water dikinase